MALTLLTSVVTSGLEVQSGFQLMTLKNFVALTPPVTEASMRTELETSQPVGFISDAAWLSFVAALNVLPIDPSLLTLAERSVINTLRAIVEPPAQYACCGAVIPAFGDGLVTSIGYPRTGSVTFEHEITLILDASLTCDIKYIESSLNGLVAVTSPQPFNFYFKECDASGNSIYSAAWITFATDPTGTGLYDVDLGFYDGNGVLVTPAYAGTGLLTL